jgi:hypothetical protein
MGSVTTFHCDFCIGEITNKSINNNHGGVCVSSKIRGEWSNDLYDDVHGPHICIECCLAAMEFFGKAKI